MGKDKIFIPENAIAKTKLHVGTRFIGNFRWYCINWGMKALTIFRWLLWIGIALLTGTEFASTFCVHPVLVNLSPSEYISIRQLLNQGFTPVVARLLFSTGVLLLINLFTVRSIKSTEFIGFAVAFGLYLMGILITIYGTVPINVMFDKMQVGSPPAQTLALRDKWNTLNQIRTSISLAGLVAYSFTLLFLQKNDHD